MLQELCIRRPVMTILLMVSFLFAGLFAYRLLPVAAVPRVDYPTISVSASLPGASPETMAASVASILERQFSAIAGVTSINSTSSLGQTQITLQFDLARGIDAAAADVQSAISSATRRLPSAMPSPPSYRKVNPADQPILFLALTSSVEQLSSVDRLAQSLILPQLSILPGVAQVSIFGSQKYAVRIRVDLDKLAARGLTMADLSSAISSANSNTPVGSINEGGRTIILDATGPLARAADFAAIPIDVRGGTAIHLSDVASVIDSVENLQSASWLNDTRGIVLAVQRQPDANTVEVVDKVKALIPSIRAGLPGTIDLQVMNDRSQSIRNSVADVTRSLLISGGLVVLVIFLFLGSLRATIIPALALPVSIIGTFSGMWLFGHSIDNISLLALTLCVGFVVDDAIVVLENVTRHAEEGTKPFEAAIIGSREVGFTILSMTLSLVAVFLPVLLMGGVVGRVFNEFGVDITIAILISGVVSLTLTPMLAARLVKVKPKSEKAGGVFSWFARGFDAITRAYAWSVRQTLRATWLMLLVALGTLAGTIYL